jgi:hypothetical protein
MTTHSSGLIPTHIYKWLLTPLAWYSVDTHTVMYICVCGYQARGVSSHVYMCVCVSSQRSEYSCIHVCVGIKPTHTHIYMTTHSSGLIPTQIYMTIHYSGLIPTHTCIHDYSLLWLDTHTYMCMTCTKPKERVVMYICVWPCTKPEERVVMYICLWVSSQRSE